MATPRRWLLTQLPRLPLWTLAALCLADAAAALLAAVGAAAAVA